MYFFRELLNQNRSVHNSFDDKSLLKLTFTTRPIWCTVHVAVNSCQLQPSFQSFSLSPTRRSVSLGRDENPGNEVAVNASEGFFFFHLH